MATVNGTTELVTRLPGGDGPIGPASSASLTEAIRHHFRNDRSRMTMLAAKKFRVPEQVVIEALADHWPITRVRQGTFRELMDVLPELGLVRIFVRSRAAVLETVGTFGGYSESGPFFNVQSDSVDMHILLDEISRIYAVEKTGHDSDNATYSFQFFDRAGDAAFKVFLWEDFPNVPATRIETFREIARKFAQDPADTSDSEGPDELYDDPPDSPLTYPYRSENGSKGENGAANGTAARPADTSLLRPFSTARGIMIPVPKPLPIAEPSGDVPPVPEPEPAALVEVGSDPDMPRVAIPMPEGILPGSATYTSRILADGTGVVDQKKLPTPKRVIARRYATWVTVGLSVATILYLLVATFVTPMFWRHYEHHTKLADAPRYTLSDRNALSDPINIGLLGQDWEIIRALIQAGWTPSDPLTFQTGLKYAKEALRSRPYPSTTLADLYLFGRRQDLMFEKPNAKKGRRALRLWRANELGMGGRPLWLGSVSLDLGDPPGKPKSERGSHRIASDLDAQRDALVSDLSDALRLTEVFHVTGVGPTVFGSNDADQSYFTDGELAVAIISAVSREQLPQRLDSPWGIRMKDRIFDELRPLLREEDE